MTITILPTAPVATLSTQGRRSTPPVPPLTAVLVDIDDDRSELVVTIDDRGQMVARLFARDVGASGNCPALVSRSAPEATMAVGSLVLLGMDLASDGCVAARAAVALSWYDDGERVVALGSAVVDVDGSNDQRRFVADPGHLSAQNPSTSGAAAPFPCHLPTIREL